ncbi:MAG: hypothetical protein LBI99_08705 [Propionibacteriaceae bacterium]|jgi:hypothetical protein|nr:hypothetical protein [Propionibacteriaceae bacterium]
MTTSDPRERGMTVSKALRLLAVVIIGLALSSCQTVGDTATPIDTSSPASTPSEIVTPSPAAEETPTATPVPADIWTNKDWSKDQQAAVNAAKGFNLKVIPIFREPKKYKSGDVGKQVMSYTDLKVRSNYIKAWEEYTEKDWHVEGVFEPIWVEAGKVRKVDGNKQVYVDLCVNRIRLRTVDAKGKDVEGTKKDGTGVIRHTVEQRTGKFFVVAEKGVDSSKECVET